MAEIHLCLKNSDNLKRSINFHCPYTLILQKWEKMTCIASMEMNSTEQWDLATKSKLTPKVPAHRKSLERELSPMQSLHHHQHKSLAQQHGSTAETEKALASLRRLNSKSSEIPEYNWATGICALFLLQKFVWSSAQEANFGLKGSLGFREDLIMIIGSSYPRSKTKRRVFPFSLWLSAAASSESTGSSAPTCEHNVLK
jgi:hypothetical protein